MNKRILIGLPSLFLAVASCFGWGQKGHDVISYIAECNLSETTRAAVDSLLDGKSIVYYANWLDNASHTPQYEYTKTWHYKNIDPDQTYESAPLNPKGDIVVALQTEIADLKTGKLSKEEASLALKIIVHLMGDIHQPMHMGRLSDLGGNKHKVVYFNRDNNLHAIWDSQLVESSHKWSYTEWKDQIMRGVTSEKMTEYMEGCVYSWGKETYQIAKAVYDATPEYHKVSYDYIAEWTPTIELQFLKSGLRLADVLNGIFDPNYKPVTHQFEGGH